MRILFLAHRIPYPPNKGDKIRAFWELRTLCGKHDVDLFCFCDDPADMGGVEHLKKLCHSVYVEYLPPFRARVSALRAFLARRPLTLGFYASSTMREAIERAASAAQYDVAFVFSSSMAPYVDNLHIRRIADLVDSDAEKWHEYSQHCSLATNWLWRIESQRLARYEHLIARTYDLTTLCTDAEANFVRSGCLDGRIATLRHPVDLEYWNPSGVTVPPEIKAMEPYVIFSGTMDYLANVDAVLFLQQQVMPKLREQHPELKLVIAGRNPVPEVRALASASTIITGTVDDIRPYLAGAAAAVLPLRIARGVPNKVLEAIAMGLPVITTSKAAAAFGTDLRSLMHLADTPEEIAAAIHDTITTPRPAIEMFRNTLAQAYGADRLGTLLESIVSGTFELQPRAMESAAGRRS